MKTLGKTKKTKDSRREGLKNIGRDQKNQKKQKYRRMPGGRPLLARDFWFLVFAATKSSIVSAWGSPNPDIDTQKQDTSREPKGPRAEAR